MSQSPEPSSSLWATVTRLWPGRSSAVPPAPDQTVLINSPLPLTTPDRPTPLTITLTWLDEPPQQVTIEAPKTYLGRNARACEVVIPLVSVSQVHAVIERQEPTLWPRLLRRLQRQLGWARPRYLLRDQSSTNGLVVKDWRRQAKRVPQVALGDRQVVTLGPTSDPLTVSLQAHYPQPPSVQVVRTLLVSVLVVPLLGLGWLGAEWQRIPTNPLPSLGGGPLLLVAGDGSTPLRRTLQDNQQELATLADFGPYVPVVTVASEDHRFFRHGGVDLIGIGRAAVGNLGAGQIQQGGSTLSQQLARTLLRDYTGLDNTLARKLREALAAIKLESQYSKSELLRLYLNAVYMGNGLYGFESAAQFYFGRAAADLSVGEAATLAGLLPAPNRLNPVDDREAALRARNRVLNRLSQLRTLPQEDIRRAQRSLLSLNPNLDQLSVTVAPYFYAAALEELNDLLGADLASAGDFWVETTVQLPVQQVAERAIAQAVQQQGSQEGFGQGALVTVDSRTGEVIALVGGTDYQGSQFNRAVQAQRQPGSTFKVFAYAAALSQGISPSQTYPCTPFDWQQVFDGCRSTAAPMSAAQGLVRSENVIALRLAQQVGLNAVIQMAQRMGIRSPLPAFPSLILGTVEVNLLELTGAFGSLANQGQYQPPRLIRRILDTSDCGDRQELATCREIFPGQTPVGGPETVLSPAVANDLTRLLQQAVQQGTAQTAHLGRGEAGKTGTTTGNRDLLFVGYLPEPRWVTGVWLGNDDNTPTTGSSATAATVWANYIRQALP